MNFRNSRERHMDSRTRLNKKKGKGKKESVETAQTMGRRRGQKDPRDVPSPTQSAANSVSRLLAILEARRTLRIPIGDFFKCETYHMRTST